MMNGIAAFSMLKKFEPAAVVETQMALFAYANAFVDV